MPFCSKCGREIEGDDKYCNSCGQATGNQAGQAAKKRIAKYVGLLLGNHLVLSLWGAHTEHREFDVLYLLFYGVPGGLIGFAVGVLAPG